MASVRLWNCTPIGPNKGLLPELSVLTADLHLGIDLSDGHDNIRFSNLRMHIGPDYNSFHALSIREKSELILQVVAS